MAILVVGGAGYIGSYTCKYLHNNGYLPVVLDNLSTGHAEAVQWGPLVVGDCGDSLILKEIYRQFKIEAVMHFAASCYVGESCQTPLKYYKNNVGETIGLLNSMMENNINKFILSSSCAVFGEPEASPIPEEMAKCPINPYGRSKLMIEQILSDIKTSHHFQSMVFRYFNAAGADPEGDVGENHDPETHLIPLAISSALTKGNPLKIFGNDYPTKDGTCVRDYIHIHDLASAHVLGLERLLNGDEGDDFNLGIGRGYSVMEIIGAIEEVTGQSIEYHVVERRPGDPACLTSSNQKAKKLLGWEIKYGQIKEIVQTAVRWSIQNNQ